MNEIIHNNENIRIPENRDMEEALNFVTANCDECGKKLDENYYACLEAIRNDTTFNNMVNRISKNVVNHPIDRDDANILKLNYAARNNLNQLPIDSELRTLVRNDMLMAQHIGQSFSVKEIPEPVIENDPLKQISDRIKSRLTPEQINDFTENLKKMNDDQKKAMSTLTDNELYSISLLLGKDVEKVKGIPPIQIMKIAHHITEARLSPEAIRIVRLIFNRPARSTQNLTFITSGPALSRIGDMNIEQIKMLSGLEEKYIRKLYWLNAKQISRITSKNQIDKIPLPLKLKYPAYDNAKIQEKLRSNLTNNTINTILDNEIFNKISPYELNMVNELYKDLLSNDVKENLTERDDILFIIDKVKDNLFNFLNNESIVNLEENNSTLLKLFIDDLGIKDTLQKLSPDRKLVIIEQIACLVNRVKNAKEFVKNLENVDPDGEDRRNALYNILKFSYKGTKMKEISSNMDFENERKNNNVELEQEGSGMIFYLSSNLYEEFIESKIQGGSHIRGGGIPIEIDGTLCIIKKKEDQGLQNKAKNHELQHAMNYFFMEKEDNTKDLDNIKDEILSYLGNDKSLLEIRKILKKEPYSYDATSVDSTVNKLENYSKTKENIKDKINVLMITKIDEWEGVLK